MGGSEPLRIIGAGPSGLAAAITASRAGRKAVVLERHHDVGARFKGDFQGLENWTTPVDALDDLLSLGIEPTFEAAPVFEQVCYGPDGVERLFRSRRPFYYLVRRGSAPGTLDQALKQQALAAGVEIRFGEAVRVPGQEGLGAWGPRRADAVAVGYLFETDLPDSSFAVLSNRFAPWGYGYLLVNGGSATLATCLFKDFTASDLYLERIVQFFQERLRFELRNARRFGGVVNACPAMPDLSQPFLRIGEASGVQDALWGFGIRIAVRSGVLAAHYGSGDPRVYRRLWQETIGRPFRTSLVNRFFFELAGDAGCRFLLKRLSGMDDPWKLMHGLYAPAAWKLALFPLTRFIKSLGRNRYDDAAAGSMSPRISR